MTFQFTDDQQNAVDTFIDFLADPKEKYLVIQGAAGSGKSTLIKHLVKIVDKHREMCSLLLKHESGFDTVLTATTNPAAAVLHDITGIPASTIHSVLGLILRTNYVNGKQYLQLKKGATPIYDSIIIIDEASMVNDELFRYIDQRTNNCKIIFIGDQYQLAPVGQTATVMEDLQAPKVLMNKVMRHGGNILQVGTQFRNTVETGIFYKIPDDCAELKIVDGPSFQQEIDSVFSDRKYTPQKGRILAWTNARVMEYSQYVRTLRGLPKHFVVGETVFTNRLINTSNTSRIAIDSAVEITGAGKEFFFTNTQVKGRFYEINGGISAFAPNDPADEKQYLKALAKEKNWHQYYLIKESWLDLRAPYASTVHKAQGNNYDTVFIDLVDIGSCFIPSDVARLLYVAITRAVKQVVFYGTLPYRYSGKVAQPSELKLEEILT